MGNGPTGHMKSHQEQGVVYLFGPSTHIRHDKGRGHGENLTALLKTKPTTAQLLFTREIGEAVESITPSKGLRKQFGMVLMEFLKPALRIGAIGSSGILFSADAIQSFWLPRCAENVVGDWNR